MKSVLTRIALASALVLAGVALAQGRPENPGNSNDRGGPPEHSAAAVAQAQAWVDGLPPGLLREVGNGMGNQGCVLLADDSYHKNPGALLLYIRLNSEALGYEADQNIVEWLENFDWDGTVGDWIERNCKLLDPPPA